MSFLPQGMFRWMGDPIGTREHELNASATTDRLVWPAAELSLGG